MNMSTNVAILNEILKLTARILFLNVENVSNLCTSGKEYFKSRVCTLNALHFQSKYDTARCKLQYTLNI